MYFSFPHNFNSRDCLFPFDGRGKIQPFQKRFLFLLFFRFCSARSFEEGIIIQISVIPQSPYIFVFVGQALIAVVIRKNLLHIFICCNLDLTDKKVVDYGCGSGILGIAALKLGAAKASGVDIDEQAIIASEENAERNGLKGKFTLYLGEASAQLEPADVTVANILAGPLAELEPEIARLTAKGGRLALSGVLKDQAQEVCKAYERDFEIGNVSSRGDWALITAVRR